MDHDYIYTCMYIFEDLRLQSLCTLAASRREIETFFPCCLLYAYPYLSMPIMANIRSLLNVDNVPDDIVSREGSINCPDACEKSMSIYYKSHFFSIFLANLLAENGDAKRKKHDPCSRTKPSPLLV